MDKPSFEASLRALNAGRRSPGDHPSPEELVFYRAGDLTADEDDRIQEHLTQCGDCARLLLDLAEFEQLTPPPDELGPVDARAEASWQRLRTRLREEEEEDREPEMEAPILRPRPRVPYWRRPALPWALAAGLALCVVGLGLRMGGLQQKVSELSEPRIGVPLLDLYPESGQTTRGETERAAPVTGPGPFLLLQLPEGSPISGTYETEIVPASGEKPVFEPQRGQAEDGTLSLQIPPSLPPGSYEVHLYSLAGDRRQLLDRYRLEISSATP